MVKLSISKSRSDKQRLEKQEAAFHPNGKIKPNFVIASGVQEKHAEGRYFLELQQSLDRRKVWDALEAQRRGQLRLNNIEYARISRKDLDVAIAERSSIVEFRGSEDRQRRG